VYPTCCYLVCATPRSGSTLLCEALATTGIAGNPKEYFEALRTTGQPRRPKEYFTTVDNAEITELLGDFSRLDDISITQVFKAQTPMSTTFRKCLPREQPQMAFLVPR
jgi:LPS sulfotransferase NodH